jgi:malate dehydrogenase
MITIIGSGRVGSSIAFNILVKSLDNILLIDIVKGLPQGEALDLEHAACMLDLDVKVSGSNEFSDMEGSDIVIISAGSARKPGMTRLDLLKTNYKIVKEISQNIAKYAKDSKVIVVTNPLDVMTYVALKFTEFEMNRVLGMGGMLDASRLKYLITSKLCVSRKNVKAMVIGEHGENMLPLANQALVENIPLKKFVSDDEINEIVEKTRGAAIEVISLKGSTFHAPGACVAELAEAIIKNERRLLPVSCYLEGEYGVNGICIGVPAIIGKDGVEEIVEIELNDKERDVFMKGVETIRNAIKELGI